MPKSLKEPGSKQIRADMNEWGFIAMANNKRINVNKKDDYFSDFEIRNVNKRVRILFRLRLCEFVVVWDGTKMEVSRWWKTHEI